MSKIQTNLNSLRQAIDLLREKAANTGGDSSEYEDGDNLIYGGASGYSVVINSIITRGGGTLYYSLDNGLSWTDITTDGIITINNVSQIKFKITDAMGVSSSPLVSPTLGLHFMVSEESSTNETQNFILTKDVLDVNWGE